MVEKLTLPGLRLRKTELPNQVYIASKDYLCMTEVFMPAVMRNARPEQAVEMVQQEVRAMAELEVVDQEEYDRLSGRDKGVGLYATCDPRVRGLADQRIEYAKSVFSSPRTVQRLSPLSLVQYAADGLDLAHGEYLSEHPEAVSAEEPSLDVMLFEGAELLNVEGRMVILINGGSLEDFFGRGK